MIPKFSLCYTSLWLASAALAIPSRLAEQIAPRGANHQSQPLNHVYASTNAPSNTIFSSNWAGAAQFQDNGTFSTIIGTFTAPTISGKDGAAVGVWIGMDGGTNCPNALLQTGIAVTVGPGGPTYDAWYQWQPEPSNGFPGITISAGNVISANITTSSPTSAVLTLENRSTGVIATQEVSSSHALCQADAEWIVEDFTVNGNPVPLANFGTVTITAAVAFGPIAHLYTPFGSTVIEMEGASAVTTNETSVTIQYTGS